MRTMRTYMLLLAAAMVLAVPVCSQSLDEYMEEAGRNNPELRYHYDQYLAALQRIPQVGALPDPEAGFGYFLSPVETRVGPQRLRLSAMQMFPWFGTLSARKDVAAMEAKAKHATFEAVRNALYFRLRKVWYQLADLQEAIQLSQQHLEILRSYERLALQRFENGRGTMVDVLRIQVEQKELENAIATLEDKQRPLVAAFNEVLNREPESLVVLPDTIVGPPFNISKTGVMDSIRSGNEHLKAIAWQREAADQALEVARLDGKPTFGLGLNYIMTGARSDVELPDNGKDVLLPMVSVRIPLYRAKYRAKQEEAKLRRSALDNLAAAKTNALASDLESNWVAIEDADRRIRHYEAQQVITAQAQAILVQTYTTGGKDFEEILRFERKLLDFELKVIHAVRDRSIAIAKIDLLYGRF